MTAGILRSGESRTNCCPVPAGHRKSFSAFQPTFLVLALTASLAAVAALTVADAAAAKFDSAQSAACLAALLTVSNAVLDAATALLNIDSAGSEPAGAFLVAKSISSLTLRLPSANWASTIFEISALAPLAMPYMLRE